MERIGKIYNIIILGLLIIIFALVFCVNHFETRTKTLEGKHSQISALANALTIQNRKLNTGLTNKMAELEVTQANLRQMTRIAESNDEMAKQYYYEIEKLKRKIAILEETAARQRKGIGVIDDYYKKIIAALQKEIAEKNKRLLFCTQANDKLLSENSKRQKMITELEDKLQKKSLKTMGIKAPFTLYYDLNKWNIRDEEQAKNLGHNVKWMLNNWEYALANEFQFNIIGYCCRKGTPAYNWGVVGSNRALSVEKTFREALLNNGASIDEANKLLRPLSAGKYRPEHKKPENNRKVEIYLVKSFQN